MAFNAAQLTVFFTNGPQMALTATARGRLADEGLVTVDDFEDFKEDQLEIAIKNLRTAIPGIPAILELDGRELITAIPPSHTSMYHSCVMQPSPESGIGCISLLLY